MAKMGCALCAWIFAVPLFLLNTIIISMLQLSTYYRYYEQYSELLWSRPSVWRSSLNHGGGVDVSLMWVSTQLVEEVQVHRKTRRTSFVSVIIAFVTGIIAFVISFITFPSVSVTPIFNITFVLHKINPVIVDITSSNATNKIIVSISRHFFCLTQKPHVGWGKWLVLL